MTVEVQHASTMTQASEGCFERAKIADSLKHKIEQRPEKQQLVLKNILMGSSADPCIQEKQHILKRCRLADSLNDKLSQRPGPLELVQGNILHVDASLEQAIKDGKVHFKPTSAGLVRKHPPPVILLQDDCFAQQSPGGDSGSLSPQSSTESHHSSPLAQGYILSGSLPCSAGNSPLSGFLGAVPLASSPALQLDVTSATPQLVLSAALVAARPKSRGKRTLSKAKNVTTNSGSSTPVPSSQPSRQRVIKFHEYKGPSSSQKASSQQNINGNNANAVLSADRMTTFNAAPNMPMATGSPKEVASVVDDGSAAGSCPNETTESKKETSSSAPLLAPLLLPPLLQPPGDGGEVSSYELLLQQQQLYLQWEVELKQKYPNSNIQFLPVTCSPNADVPLLPSSVPSVDSSAAAPLMSLQQRSDVYSNGSSTLLVTDSSCVGPPSCAAAALTEPEQSSAMLSTPTSVNASYDSTYHLCSTQAFSAPPSVADSSADRKSPTSKEKAKSGGRKGSQAGLSQTKSRSANAVPSGSCSSSGAKQLITKLEDMRVSDLKTECKKRNLPVSGPKPNLLERLKPFEDLIVASAVARQECEDVESCTTELACAVKDEVTSGDLITSDQPQFSTVLPPIQNMTAFVLSKPASYTSNFANQPSHFFDSYATYAPDCQPGGALTMPISPQFDGTFQMVMPDTFCGSATFGSGVALTESGTDGNGHHFYVGQSNADSALSYSGEPAAMDTALSSHSPTATFAATRHSTIAESTDAQGLSDSGDAALSVFQQCEQALRRQHKLIEELHAQLQRSQEQLREHQQLIVASRRVQEEAGAHAHSETGEPTDQDELIDDATGVSHNVLMQGNTKQLQRSHIQLFLQHKVHQQQLQRHVATQKEITAEQKRLKEDFVQKQSLDMLQCLLDREPRLATTIVALLKRHQQELVQRLKSTNRLTRVSSSSSSSSSEPLENVSQPPVRSGKRTNCQPSTKAKTTLPTPKAMEEIFDTVITYAAEATKIRAAAKSSSKSKEKKTVVTAAKSTDEPAVDASLDNTPSSPGYKDIAQHLLLSTEPQDLLFDWNLLPGAAGPSEDPATALFGNAGFVYTNNEAFDDLLEILKRSESEGDSAASFALNYPNTSGACGDVQSQDMVSTADTALFSETEWADAMSAQSGALCSAGHMSFVHSESDLQIMRQHHHHHQRTHLNSDAEQMEWLDLILPSPSGDALPSNPPSDHSLGAHGDRASGDYKGFGNLSVTCADPLLAPLQGVEVDMMSAVDDFHGVNCQWLVA